MSKLNITKEQYEGIKKIYIKKDITVELAKKSGFKTKKEMELAHKNILLTRKNRMLNAINFKIYQTAYDKYLNKRAGEIVELANPSFKEVHAEYGNEFSIEYSSHEDWNCYSKRYRHPARVHEYYITIPKTGIHIEFIDGCAIIITSTETINNYVCKHGYSIKKKGCKLLSDPCVIVYNNNNIAKGKDFNEAFKKIKKIEKKLK